jgi:hypothetical protein
MAEGGGRLVTGSLDATGLSAALRNRLQQPPARRSLTAALSPDGVGASLRAHRVTLVPNPHRQQ